MLVERATNHRRVLLSMSFISFAKNFEDVMLWRALKHIEHGFYIDVGAQHPVVDSVSLAFYKHGWRGVHIEPAPFYANLLRKHRPDEVTIQVVIGAKAGPLPFFDVADTGPSTFNESVAHSLQDAGFNVDEIVVPCLSLDDVLAPFAGRDIHWLKIDVEGQEREVLEGWKTEAIKPWVLVIESTLPGMQTETWQVWQSLILGRGYQFVYFDGLNRFFLSSDHADLKDAFSCGPNVFDGFVLSGTASSRFCADLNAQVKELGRQKQVLEEELGRQRQVLDGELRQLENKLAAVYGSWSWRITNPLRKANLLVKHYTSFMGTGLLNIRHMPTRLKPKARIISMPRKLLTSALRETVNRARSVGFLMHIAHKIKMRYPKLWKQTCGRFTRGIYRHNNTILGPKGKECLTFDNPPIALSEIKHRLQAEVRRQNDRGWR